jgi:hypothetical protein
LVVGCWLLVVGCWLLVVGCWLLFTLYSFFRSRHNNKLAKTIGGMEIAIAALKAVGAIEKKGATYLIKTEITPESKRIFSKKTI